MNQILLVEGKDDFHVFKSIFIKYNVKESFKIKDTEGIDNLLKRIPIDLKSDITTMGIIVDADTNIESRWNSIKSILLKAGYPMPDEPQKNGIIITSELLPTIGIWIMPNNIKNGMLEDFVSYLIPTDDKLLPEVESALLSIENKKLNKYKLIHKEKAKIHTWLAWQETPGNPMGLAITKTYLNTNNETCKLFIGWTNDLYNSRKDVEQKF